MKAIKSSLFFLVSLILWSCFDEPEFSSVPEIKFEDVYFGKATSTNTLDSLVVTISFQDGDGDLGIPSIEDPYHERNFYLGAGGSLNPVGTVQYSNTNNFINPGNASGQLIIYRNRRQAAYANQLPPFPGPESLCGPQAWFLYSWLIDDVYIAQGDARIIPDQVVARPVEGQNGFPDALVVRDTFYVQRNENYSNIEVKFYRKPTRDSPEYTLVDWEKLACSDNYNGRFPVLTGKQNALSGTISYSMKGSGFDVVMASGIWKLEVQIRDRARNLSNVVSSREFALQDIRR